MPSETGPKGAQTIDERLADLERAHAEKRAEIERERGLFASLAEHGLPLPTRVMHFTPRPWLIYADRAGVDEVLATMRVFAPYLRDVGAVSSGCLYVQPIEDLSKRFPDKDPKWVTPDCVVLDLEGTTGEHSYSSWGMSAEVRLPFGEFRIKVDPAFRAPAPMVGIRAEVERDWQKRVIRAWWEMPRLHAEHARTKWSAGDGSGKAYHFSVYYSGVPEALKVNEANS